MFNEYDVVYSTIELPKVPLGSIGTILVIHDSGADYVVEFVDTKTGDSLNILTVNERDIKKINLPPAIRSVPNK